MPEPAASTATKPPLPSSDITPPETYFRGVSSLSRRLLDDMKAVRESWGDEWHDLTYPQQCRVLDQAIVDEETVLKYEGEAEGGPEYEYFPKLKLTTGQKVVCDENLTARGFACSWRDEHSAPFSWHTRSQMDLTLDTPPDTPTHPPTPPDHPPTTVAGEGRVIPGGRAVYTARPVSLPRPPRFRWHYDPPENLPDPPSVVVASPKTYTLTSGAPYESKKSPVASKFLLVRGRTEGGEGAGGLLSRIKTALTSLTATCLPIRATTSSSSTHGHTSSLFYLPSDPDTKDLTTHAPANTLLPTPQVPPTTTTKLEISTHLESKMDASRTPINSIPALSRLSPDPTLAGYVCSLPDDDDDEPYTAAKPLQASLSHSTASGGGCSSREALLTPSSSGDSTRKDDGVASIPSDLPTPLPTPTVSDATKTVSTVLSRPTSSSTCAPSPSHLDDTLSAISEPDSSTDALDTPREEQPLLRVEKKRTQFDENADTFISVLSTSGRDSNIPKTGFDFLDNW